MSRWPRAPLGAICEINPKQNGAERLAPDAEVSFVPMAAVDETSGRIAVKETRPLDSVTKGYTVFRNDDVLFAKITPCMENGKAAIARQLTNGVGFGSTEFHVLRPKPGLLPEWVFAFIRQPAFRDLAKANFTGTAGQQRVPADFLKQIQVPLPPLPEQERIVRILDEAEALRRLRAQADDRTEKLIESVFIDLFLRDHTRHTWSTESIEDLAEPNGGAIRTGPFGSQLLHSEFTDTGVPVLAIDNVVTNEFRWISQRCIPQEKFGKFQRFQVFPGDVLITIMGTVGRCCVAPDDLPVCMSTKHLCVITPKRDGIHPRYLWASLLFDPDILQQTSAAGGGAIMEGWNSTIIRQLKLRVPPMPLQRAFAAHVAEIRELQTAQPASRRRLEDLFQSLLHRAFEGEL